MNQKSHSRGELTRPVTQPADVMTTEPPGLIPGSLRARSGIARSDAATTPSPMSILRALRRQQTLALGVAILLTRDLCSGGLVLRPREVQGPGPVAGHRPTAEGAVPDRRDRRRRRLRRYQQTQMTLVKSRLVLNAALQDEKVAKCRMVREQLDPITWLQEALTVEFISGSEVMEISLSGDDNRRACGRRQRGQKSLHGRSRHVRHQAAQRNGTRSSRSIKERYTAILKERRDTQRKLAEAVGSNDPKTLVAQTTTCDGTPGTRQEASCWMSGPRNAGRKPSSGSRRPTEDQTVATRRRRR